MESRIFHAAAILLFAIVISPTLSLVGDPVTAANSPPILSKTDVERSSFAASPTSRPTQALYITHVTVIDTLTGLETHDQTVVISGDRISQIINSTKLRIVPDGKQVDGTGRYLIPGLWDMHVHVWNYESTYSLFIANGVTGVRDMFGPPDANAFRRELANKPVLAPHFYLASPILDGHPAIWRESIEVTTPEQARRIVADQKAKGADFIKVYNLLTPEVYAAIANEAARLGIAFEGHVPNRVTAWDASKAKQKSIEHLSGVALACSAREQELRAKVNAEASVQKRWAVIANASESFSDTKCDKLIKRFRAKRTWQVPTLTVERSFAHLDDPAFVHDDRLRYFKKVYRDWLAPDDDSREKWTKEDLGVQRKLYDFDKMLVKVMFRAGIPMLAGTDAGNPYCFPGFSLHDELALLVESGLSPLAALQAATLNPAIFMNASDRYGSVSSGKIADLVLLDADPLKDIHNTTKISAVFLAGREFDKSDIDRLLKSAEDAAK